MITSRLAALAAVALSLGLFSGCKKDSDSAPQPGSVVLHFENVVGSDPLTLDTQQYTNQHGEPFTVSTFKYYVSNVVLTKADNGRYAAPDSYFLVDQARPTTYDLTIPNVPAGDYTGLSFVVGVDSARTKAGNFTGVLRDEFGMFWPMGGGEFFNVRLEGSSPRVVNNLYKYHIAGYKGGVAGNTVRTVAPAFPANTKLLIRADHTPEVHVQADVLSVFGDPSPRRLSDGASVMMAPATVRVANNIAAGMFTVEHIHAH